MARRKLKRKNPPHRRRAALAPPPPPAAPSPYMAPSQVLAARELFWHNVIREILTSLSMLCAMRPEPAAEGQPAAPDEIAAEAQADAAARGEPAFDPTLFDGRLAIMTKAGERVAIADVYPLFACGISNPHDRGLSIALECTVFQIRTPDGHVYTLPLHEMRAFHALTPELMRRLERIARRKRSASRGDPDEEQQPFGFAAFTSLIQGPPAPPDPAPEHPTE